MLCKFGRKMPTVAEILNFAEFRNGSHYHLRFLVCMTGTWTTHEGYFLDFIIVLILFVITAVVVMHVAPSGNCSVY